MLVLIICGILSACESSAEPVADLPLRDNTPDVLQPLADGITVYENDTASIDASHVDCGYISVLYNGSKDKSKLQIAGPDTTVYTYNLSDNYQTFPLTGGDGTYTLTIYENVSGTQYAVVYSPDIETKLQNDKLPYLYPNQYVWFNAQSQVVEQVKSLAATAHTDL